MKKKFKVGDLIVNCAISYNNRIGLIVETPKHQLKRRHDGAEEMLWLKRRHGRLGGWIVLWVETKDMSIWTFDYSSVEIENWFKRL